MLVGVWRRRLPGSSGAREPDLSFRRTRNRLGIDIDSVEFDLRMLGHDSAQSSTTAAAEVQDSVGFREVTPKLADVLVYVMRTGLSNRQKLDLIEVLSGLVAQQGRCNWRVILRTRIPQVRKPARGEYHCTTEGVVETLCQRPYSAAHTTIISG
jgi:hypothetical protein